ncbi:unnamed protein product [Leuciscus chuanchicus]
MRTSSSAWSCQHSQQVPIGSSPHTGRQALSCPAGDNTSQSQEELWALKEREGRQKGKRNELSHPFKNLDDEGRNELSFKVTSREAEPRGLDISPLLPNPLEKEIDFCLEFVKSGNQEKDNGAPHGEDPSEAISNQSAKGPINPAIVRPKPLPAHQHIQSPLSRPSCSSRSSAKQHKKKKKDVEM